MAKIYLKKVKGSVCCCAARKKVEFCYFAMNNKNYKKCPVDEHNFLICKSNYIFIQITEKEYIELLKKTGLKK